MLKASSLESHTTGAVVQGGGARALVLSKASQQNNFFASLPLNNNHTTPPSQAPATFTYTISTDPPYEDDVITRPIL